MRMSEAAQAKLAEVNATAPDWVIYCRKCGTKRTGTLEELQAHAAVCYDAGAACPEG
jgi:hypothetical protein